MSQHVGNFTGTVKSFNKAKGYGFIGRLNGPDVFCHYTAILGMRYRFLKEGEQVTFNIVPGREHKVQADKVRKLLALPDAPTSIQEAC